MIREEFYTASRSSKIRENEKLVSVTFKVNTYPLVKTDGIKFILLASEGDIFQDELYDSVLYEMTVLPVNGEIVSSLKLRFVPAETEIKQMTCWCYLALFLLIICACLYYFWHH